MSFNHTLSAVLRGRWLIDRAWAEAHIPLVLSMLKGNPVSFVERTGSEDFEMPFVIDPATMERFDYYKFDWATEKYIPNPNIPNNSVGVLPIKGPITKYNGVCGEAGAILHASRLLDMSKRSNIGSVILLSDTPGGEVSAANPLTTALKNFNKPKITYVDGFTASLGMYLICGSDEAYVSSKIDEVGSVGTMCSILDFTGYLENEGIKLHDIYAPQSKDKNKDYKDALAGDYTAIQNDLKIITDSFISYVKEGRPQTAATESEWNTGKMFYPAEAQKLGLIDGVRDLNQVVSKAAWLAKRNK
jgi:protease-4